MKEKRVEPGKAVETCMNCPLKGSGIPYHGRLIDADKLKALVDNSMLLTAGFVKTFDALIDGEPTVIPANMEEE